MKQGNIYLVDLEFEYKLWKKRIDLFIRELRLMSERNDELRLLAGRKELGASRIDVLMGHRKELEMLLNRIKVKEQELQYYNKDFPITDTHQYYVDHLELRNQMQRVLNDHLQIAGLLVGDLSI